MAGFARISVIPGHEPLSEQRLGTGGGNARAPARRPGRRTDLERGLDAGGDELRGLRVDGDVPAEQYAADDLPDVRGYRRRLGHTRDCRRNQRKKSFVKRCWRVSGAIANGLMKWGSCYGWSSTRRGFGAGSPGVLAAGMPKSRAGMTADAVPGARHLGLLAPRSASGLGPGPAGGGRACPDSVQPSW
jgi:hypothetical protein